MLDLIIGDIVSILCVLPAICFALGAFWFVKSFIEHIATDLSHLDVKKKTHGHDERELGIHFCQIVKLYTDLKELRANFNHNH